MHPAQLPINELLEQCTLTLLRRGGPGGQHRNKVETAVGIEHLPTGVSAEASERRSQSENRRVAIQRLRLNLAVDHRASATSEQQTPSPLWQSRVKGTRIAVSTEHEDFPALLSELLDYLTAAQLDMSSAAEHFHVTSSQLVNLLRSYPPALATVNAQRSSQGLGKLR